MTITLDGTTGITTPGLTNTGTSTFTSVAVSGAVTLSGGTANGVGYLNGSKALTTGSALTFDGTTFTSTGSQGLLNTVGGNTARMIATAAGTYFGSTTAADVIFQQNSNEGMRLTSTGLGIGTSSPTSKLTVSSTASTYAVDITSTNTSINNRTLNVYNSAATGTTALTNHIVRLASNGSGADCTLQMTDSVANNGYIGMKSGALNFGANTTTTQMTLDTSGNLGIGTSSPSAKLTVSGTANFSRFSINSNPIDIASTEQSFARFRSTGADFYLGTESSTGGAFFPSSTAYAAILYNAKATPMQFYTSGALIATLDASGNLGLGVAPSAWGSSNKALEGAYGAALSWSTGAAELNVESNAYYNGTNWIYKTSAYATMYSSGGYNGKHSWYTAPSGTAGNAFTFTQAMTLDSSGNLLVGATSSAYSNTDSVLIAPTVGGGQAVIQHKSGSSSGASYCDFIYNAGRIGNISQNGTTAVAYNTSSDYRLKNITGPITNSGAYIDSLKPVEGTWKADGSTFVGLIAHEVQETSRTVVATGTKDGEEMQGMDYSSAEIIANLIAEIQSLRVRLNALESK